MVYLHQMGISIANPGEEDSTGREHTTLRRAIQKEARERATRKWKNPTLANLMGSEYIPYFEADEGGFMDPLWKVGLHDMEDFTNEGGDRLLTLQEMRKKHQGVKLSGAHGKALQEMRRVLNAQTGVLPPRQNLLKKTGPIQAR
eukprot:4904993-Pyramimonas_sp.AAC.1